MTTRAAADDRGSVLILGVGLVAIVLLAAVVLVDATAAFLQRQRLVAVADAAALAGAQAIDIDTYYREGASARTRLQPALVPGRVQRHLVAAGVAHRIPGFAVDGIESDGRQVTVTVSAPLQLPFLSSLATVPVVAQSRAELAYRVG